MLTNRADGYFSQMPENLQSHRQVGFRFSFGAIDERDRYFQHRNAVTVKSPKDFFEVSVTLSLNSIDVNRFQGRSAIDAKGSAVVTCWQTQKDSRESVHQPRRQVPEKWPALNGSSGDVATSDRDADAMIGFFLHRVDHRTQALGRVTEVCVHGGDEVEAVFKGVTKSFDGSGSQSKLSRTMDALKRTVRCLTIAAPIPRAVGRVIVDDQNLRLGNGPLQLLDQARKVLLFVIGRNDG